MSDVEILTTILESGIIDEMCERFFNALPCHIDKTGMPIFCFQCKTKRVPETGRHFFCSEYCNRIYRSRRSESHHFRRFWHHGSSETNGWRHWFYFYRNCFSIEFCYKSSQCHAFVSVDDESHTISLAIPPLAVYLGWDHNTHAEEYSRLGITYFMGDIVIDIWNGDDWHNPRYLPFWKAWKQRLSHMRFNIVDFIFGKAHYSEEVLYENRIAFDIKNEHGLFETYDGRIKLFRSHWTRRWGKPKIVSQGTLIIQGGVPIPGKGTESYNCGPDAIMEFTSEGTCPGDIIEKLNATVVETRKRYG